MKKIFSFLLLIGFIASTYFLTYFVYTNWFSSDAQQWMRNESPFGILLIGENKSFTRDSPKKAKKPSFKIDFICVMIVNPQLSRLGFVSFLPQTKIEEHIPSMENIILSNDGIQRVKDIISQVISIEIPFFIRFKTDHISRMVDLLEGLPYFLLKSDILKGENLPAGEFFLDGSVANRLLNVETRLEHASVIYLYRYYSLILNSWEHRKEKWEILKKKPTFDLAVQDLDTNFSGKELYSMAELFLSSENWLPLFFEMPIKREDNFFLLNKEASALYFRDFQDLLTQKKNAAFQQPPSIEIRNGTNIPNLAKKIRTILSRKGFRILEFTNADHHNYKESILIDVSGKVFYLESVAKTFAIKKYYHMVNRTRFTDLILILGQDYSNKVINVTE